MPNRTSSLFTDLPLPDAANGLVKIPGSRGQLDPVQRSFNRLVSQVQALREEVAQWKTRSETLRQRMASEFMPILDAARQAQIALIKQLDALLSLPRDKKALSRSRREAVSQYLLWQLEPMLKEVEDPELIAIYDRHSELSHAESVE